MKQKYEYKTRGFPKTHAHGPDEFECIREHAADGWRLHSVFKCKTWCNYIFEREIPEPKKPDYSNASIAKANEMLTEEQREKACVPSNPIDRYLCQSCHKKSPYLAGFAGCMGGCQIERLDGTSMDSIVTPGKTFTEMTAPKGQTFGKPPAYIKRVFLTALADWRLECYDANTNKLISGSYGCAIEAEKHIEKSGYVFTGEYRQ